jgi:hypothetical protein
MRIIMGEGKYGLGPSYRFSQLTEEEVARVVDRLLDPVHFPFLHTSIYVSAPTIFLHISYLLGVCSLTMRAVARRGTSQTKCIWLV